MNKPNAFALGYQAALDGKPRKVPPHLKGGETARWFSGYAYGAAERSRKQQQPKQEKVPA
jgi:ribosome modulation factor